MHYFMHSIHGREKEFTGREKEGNAHLLHADVDRVRAIVEARRGTVGLVRLVTSAYTHVQITHLSGFQQSSTSILGTIIST
jgi:exopolysaccharide biosynthesis protein